MNQNFPALRARRSIQALTTLSVLCSFSGLSHAQSVTPPKFGIGDAVKETQPPQAPTTRPAAPLLIEQQELPLSLAAGETLHVEHFQLEGAEFIPEAELQALLAPYQGRDLSLAQIQQAAAKLTVLYRSRGYLVARAYVPRQDASKGTLVIRILIGKYGQFTLKNRSLVRDSQLQAVFAPLQGDVSVSQAALERAMLLIGDMPGAALPKLTIGPGKAPGSSDFEVDVGEGKRIGGYLMVDNRDSQYTGKDRLSGGIDINSPFGVADKLSLNFVDTVDSRLVNGRLAYAIPLSTNGLRAELAVARTTYDLGGAYADLGATGTARSVDGTLSYPLLRSRAQNLYLSLNVASRNLRDEIAANHEVNPKTAQVATFGAQHEAWGSMDGRALYTKLAASLTYGQLNINDATQAAQNRAGADTAGHYARFNLDVSGNVELPSHWSVNADLGLQKALGDKNLDGSEQMSISGRDGVRAYRESVSGDNGYLLDVTLRYALPTLAGWTQSLSLFADTGRVYLQNGNYVASNGERLSDAGLGYSASYRAWFAQLQLAHPVGARPLDQSSSNVRVLAQLGIIF